MKYSDDCIKWAKNILHNNSNVPGITSVIKIVDTKYSSVYRIHTESICYYLKQTSEKLSLEASIIKRISELCPAGIPTVVAQNSELNCFLMHECGQSTLRSTMSGHFDIGLIDVGIRNYTSIQRCMEKNIEELLALGIPDWRIESLPKLYQKLIKQESLLVRDGMTSDEISQLTQRYQNFQHSCQILSENTIPQTIDHCDFHDNNCLLDEASGKISIIDWGETVITHPFFSLAGCLWNLCYHTELTPSSQEYKQLILLAVQPWSDLYDTTKLIDIFNIISNLNGVYAALSYERLQQATGEWHNALISGKPGAITGCLRSYLHSSSL